MGIETFVGKLLNDLRCFRDTFAMVEHIDLSAITDEFTEEEAMDWFATGMKFAHGVKHAGGRFMMAADWLDRNLVEARNAMSKRQLARDSLQNLLQRLERELANVNR